MPFIYTHTIRAVSGREERRTDVADRRGRSILDVPDQRILSLKSDSGRALLIATIPFMSTELIGCGITGFGLHFS